MKTITSLEELLALKPSDIQKDETIAIALNNYPGNTKFTAKMRDFRERHYSAQKKTPALKLKAKKFIPSIDSVIKFPEAAFTDLISAPVLIPFLAYALILSAYSSRKQRIQEFEQLRQEIILDYQKIDSR